MKESFLKNAEIKLEVGTMEYDIASDTVSEFTEVIKQASSLDINVCYQCKKCTSGCPVAYEMDYTPTQLIHAIHLGMKSPVLNSDTIWLCASCETCTTRCPQDVDIATLMDTLRIMAVSVGIKSKVPGVSTLYRRAHTNIRFFGPMYELGLIGMLKLATGQFTRDMDLGIKMLRKRKLKLLPSFQGSSTTRRIFAKVKELEKV